MIPVTKPYLPGKEEYLEYLDKVWEANWFTNNGPLVRELEQKLEDYFNVPNLFLTNGTIALQIALKELNITKEVITTPFSYVATLSSIVWEGCTPVFADIDPKTLNIDPKEIESLINEDTEAILATHCFGNPCNIGAIQAIAEKHNLKVIYDAAHCFGSTYEGKSVFAYGDISTTSFHATKLFHTVEGGAIFTRSEKIKDRVSKSRNFGHNGPYKFSGVGINGKNSELHAAMGLVNLKHIDKILNSRKEQFLLYSSKLNFDRYYLPEIEQNADSNYSYFPLIFENENLVEIVIEKLTSKDIYPRRYFYPSLDTLTYVDSESMTVSNDISRRVLCLPMYESLKKEEILQICEIINKA